MSKVCAIVNGAFHILWGIIFDHLGFKIPYSLISGIQFIISSSFYFAGKQKYVYFIANIFENISFSGHGTIAPPIIPKIFGMKNSITLIGITGYFTGSFGFIGALLAKLIIKNTSDFLIVYSIGGGLALMSFIICLNLKEEKFEYRKEEKEDLNFEIDIEKNKEEETDKNKYEK